MYVRIVVSDHLEIAAEHRVIADVKARNSWVQSEVRFGNVIAKDELATESAT